MAAVAAAEPVRVGQRPRPARGSWKGTDATSLTTLFMARTAAAPLSSMPLAKPSVTHSPIWWNSFDGEPMLRKLIAAAVASATIVRAAETAELTAEERPWAKPWPTQTPVWYSETLPAPDAAALPSLEPAERASPVLEPTALEKPAAVAAPCCEAVGTPLERACAAVRAIPSADV